MPSLKSPIQGFRAFCAACPDPTDVTRILAELGFRLTFQMPAKGPAFERIPAQYHYRRLGDGCEVIYLAGKDLPEDGHVFPSCEGNIPSLTSKEKCTMTAAMLPWIVIALLVGLIIGIVLGIVLASALVRGHYSHIMSASTRSYMPPPQPHYEDHAAQPYYR